jgi:para-nitrobenzyl esterase
MEYAVVETKYGKVRGVKEGSIYVWRGIPYARPPVGSLRFKAPEPPEPWDGVFDATRFGAVPYQPHKSVKAHLADAPYRLGEDCLNLNIWSPAPDGRRRPVMVWIYGGSFTSGTGNSPSYDGSSFAELGDVVFVNINYRLGLFGFLYLGEIGGPEYATSGNNGLLDQIAALRWVRDNIEAFGGDPDQVTIFGESAGAGSVATLMGMPEARPLFHRAILQSGSHRHMIWPDRAADNARKAFRQLGIAESEWRRILEIEPEKLVEVTANAATEGMTYLPVVDGISIPKHPFDAYKDGETRHIPTLIGTTLDEMRLMYVYDPDWANFPDDEAAVRWFDRRFGTFPEEVKRFYIHMDMPGEPFVHKLVAMLGYRNFTWPAIELAEQQVLAGAPVWMFRFDWRGNGMNGLLGACHALEIPFVFNKLDAPRARTLRGNRTDGNLANRMHRAWIAFARNGDPNTPEIPAWPKYTLEERHTMIFNTETKVESDPAKDERLLWDKAAGGN